MMQLVNSSGTVILEREKSSTKKAKNSTLRARRMTQGLKKTIRPVLMSKEEFFGDFLITNKDDKTTFQFRTPSEGGVEL
ncbi:MAG: hypothetical protein IKN08_06970 [Bacteroidales bacterium]|nr:hypothetical protein [Bacteroidales bacterium]MBR6929467.1 hypothetical protein [Bacteroidales bacterium]